MPRNDQITRQWHVLRLLESTRGVTLNDMKARLPGGKLRMTLAVADSRELIGWVLSFGSGVKVIRPETLRKNVVEEARKIVGGV